MQKTKILYSAKFPSRKSFPTESLLFYDSVLIKNPAFKAWSQRFEFKIALKSGESLKTLSSFENILEKISKLNISGTPKLTFIAAGGGSVGDFVGFLSSIYLRGRPLVMLPSTWLSAVDSAHGGKNGLNLSGQKNQVGTFHSPEKVFIVRELLLSQPHSRLIEGLGEFIKIAIINRPKIFRYLEEAIAKLNSQHLIKKLPEAISGKYKIVEQDPFEQKGVRRVLNLGHTMGHVFESHYGWPHGICVLLGLLFSIRWSYYLGYVKPKDYIRISNLIEGIYPSINLSEDLAGISESQLIKSLQKDKKRTSEKTIDFIFIKKVGAVQRKKVTIEKIWAEVRRQQVEY